VTDIGVLGGALFGGDIRGPFAMPITAPNAREGLEALQEVSLQERLLQLTQLYHSTQSGKIKPD